MKWLTRALAALLLFTINAPLAVVPVLVFAPKHLNWSVEIGRIEVKASEGPHGTFERLEIVTFLILVSFETDVFVLWIISKMGGPLKTDVKTSLKRFRGRIWFGSAALVGAFLATSFVFFGAAYLFPG